MGSLEGFDKKNHPVGNVIQRHIDKWNASRDKIVRDAPFRIKLMWSVGNQLRRLGQTMCKPLEDKRDAT